VAVQGGREKNIGSGGEKIRRAKERAGPKLEDSGRRGIEPILSSCLPIEIKRDTAVDEAENNCQGKGRRPGVEYAFPCRGAAGGRPTWSGRPLGLGRLDSLCLCAWCVRASESDLPRSLIRGGGVQEPPPARQPVQTPDTGRADGDARRGCTLVEGPQLRTCRCGDAIARYGPMPTRGTSSLAVPRRPQPSTVCSFCWAI
jgi:hypothetical protein